MEINLRITADPELVALLTRAVKTLEKNSQPVIEPFGTWAPGGSDEPEEKPAPKMPEVTDPRVLAASEPEVKDPPVMAAPKPFTDLTSKELQTNVVNLTVAQPKLRAKIKELVNEYAEKLSAVPEGKRAELWEKIEALSAEA